MLLKDNINRLSSFLHHRMFIGNSNIQMSREDFDSANAGRKPITMAMQFVSKLPFSKEMLKK